MTNIARYTRGHLFNLYEPKRTALVEQIGSVLGDMETGDYRNLSKFAGRIRRLGQIAHDRNCLLYVDAEQTFIQDAIESFGQQMTH